MKNVDKYPDPEQLTAKFREACRSWNQVHDGNCLECKGWHPSGSLDYCMAAFALSDADVSWTNK